MLLLSDCEIKACPKGRVKRNVVFNIDLTLSRWSTTVQVIVCDGAMQAGDKQENPVALLSDKKGGCGIYVERIRFHHFIGVQAIFPIP